jgi:branched-subunit amino acid aminotransferase/4-amino-4-deoxychorismate lyase
MPKPIYSYDNGKFVLTNDLTINVSQDMLGTFRGYRIFTSCRTLNKGNVFRLDNHIERLLSSAQKLEMQLPHNAKKLREIILGLVTKNSLAGDMLLQIMYSGGSPKPGTMVPNQPAHLYILASPLTPPPDLWYQDGISLASFVYQREWPEVKLLSYIGAVVVDQHNHLLTPPLDGTILDGITRKVILDLAQANDIQVSEKPIMLSNLSAIKEMFFASSTRNVVPVVRVDKQIIGNGKPGYLTNHMGLLMKSYQDSYTNKHQP